MPKKTLNPVLLGDDLKEPVVELGRITYKSSGISLYLPKRIVEALNLNPEIDRSLIIFGIEDCEFFLIKDKALADSLKPQILELRERIIKLTCSL